MVTIYAIEDINDLIYVGSTIQKLNKRLVGHRKDKRNNVYLSSSKLNLDYCIIYELEKCNEEDRIKTEAYWIEKLQSVNDLKLNSIPKESKKKWYIKNRKRLLEEYHKNKSM